MKTEVTSGAQRERSAVVLVAFENLADQIERTQYTLLVPGLRRRFCPQVEVIRGEIIGRALGGTKHFRRFQGRFDQSSDTQRDAVLKLEYILQWTIKSISPQMSA